MKLEFVENNPANRRLILVFSGWSCDAAPFRNLHPDGWDIAVAYDYSSMDLDSGFLDRYETVRLFAWSLGVVAASVALAGCGNISEAVAINGTLSPVDDGKGIPTAIYFGTADNLDLRNLVKFRKRMAGNSERYRRYFAEAAVTGEEILSLKEQLYRLAELSEKISGSGHLPWKRAYVSSNDRIFPPANIKQAWTDAGVETVEIDDAHMPDFDAIVRYEIPDCRTIGAKFAAAADSYDETAVVQKEAAERLVDCLKRYSRVAPKSDILEFGAGSGLLTRRLVEEYRPKSVSIVDIFEVGPFNICHDERYYLRDAEIWVTEATGKYDLVASSSTFQWFADLFTFLKNCRSILKDDGILAFSIYIKGNLAELDAFRPVPLNYHSFEDIYRGLSDNYDIIFAEEKDRRVEFGNVRELLMHLKHTGVAGSAPSGKLRLSDMQSLRALTYRYGIFIARPLN